MTDTSPTVGIALPVFNGERYLAETLDSLLDQSFTDFEVLILDNASTDGTPEIARTYAERDARIRYERNRENVGPARNFNLAFERTSGRYFKWAAHDDLLERDFLARCVAALDADRSAVLACAKARIIDDRGSALLDYDPGLATDADNSATRLESLLHDHKCFQIFGLIRRDALSRTNLIGIHADGDGVLLQHLALLGRFVEVPEYLFLPRQHDTQSATMVGDYWSYSTWFDPSFKGRLTFPHWRWCTETFRVIGRAPLTVRERLGCLGVTSKVVLGRWRLLRGDVLYHVRPRLVAAGVPERLLRRAGSVSRG